MKAVFKKVGEPAEVIEVENKISTFEEMVGGESLALPFTLGVVMFCNEEAQESCTEKNFSYLFSADNVMYGDVLFVGESKDNSCFCGLTESEMETILNMINTKEEK